MTRSTPLHRTLLSALAACAMLAACGTNSRHDTQKLYDAGRPEESLQALEKAMKESPDNHTLRTEYFRVRELLTAQWLAQAESLRQAGELDAAGAIYRRIGRYDASNARARAGLAHIEADRRHRSIIASAERLLRAGNYAEARDTLRPVLQENPGQREAQRLERAIEERLVKPPLTTPRLKTASAKPLSLELRDVTLRNAFDVLTRATGVDFVLDKDVRPDLRTTILVREATVEEALRVILLSNQLEQKILNERTVLVYPNTPAKLREYKDLVVRAFYLANADVRQTANMIRTLVKTRDIFIDERLNLVVIKDTPDAVRLAERLIAAQDLAEPEVMLEIEVLEVASNRLLQLGLQFPDSVAWSLAGGGTTTTTTTGGVSGTGGTVTGGTTTTTGGTPGILSLSEWLNRNAGLVRLTVTNPLFLLSLHQNDGSTSTLANPSVRVKNKEKAKIHIGDRVPVITTTAAATGGFVSESVSYLDVGLKLEVEPLIYLDDEVGIKIGLEVSNIVREILGANGSTRAYQIGTRNATTTLRLRDGETQILAGLIADDDRRTANRVPGLGELPVLGRLFSATSDSRTKTEIMLLITPRLVRTLARPEARNVEFAAGTEASTGATGGGIPAGPVFPTPAQKPAAGPAPSPAPQPAAPALVPFGGVLAPRPLQQ